MMIETDSIDRHGLAVTSVTPIADVMSHPGNHQIKIKVGPVTRAGAKGSITSLYVRDPDGNRVGVSTYIQEI